MSESLILDATLATLLTPSGEGHLQFEDSSKSLHATGPDWSLKLRLASDGLGLL